jgi:hypothetical protein
MPHSLPLKLKRIRKGPRKGMLTKYKYPDKIIGFTKEECIQYLEENTFSNYDYKRHIKTVASKLKIDEVIVDDVIRHYFTKMFVFINAKQFTNFKINIYGFYSIFMRKGDRY